MDLLFPLLIVFMIGMIIFSNRQRKKQAQQQENLQNAIHVGDVVLMTSGISGTVVDIDDERTIDVEIAPEVITTWLRAAVREKLSTESDAADVVDVEDEHEHESVLEPAVSSGAPAAAPTTATTASAPAAEPKDTVRGTDSSFADPTAAPSSAESHRP